MGLNQFEINKLNERFPDHIIEYKEGFAFIPVEQVIMRLNETFNYNWSYTAETEIGQEEIKTNKCGKEYNATKVYATVELTVTAADGTVIVRTGCGGGMLNFGITPGDGHKSAVSEALKKAAQTLGIGLYLAVEGRSDKKQPTTQPTRPPIMLPVRQVTQELNIPQGLKFLLNK